MPHYYTYLYVLLLFSIFSCENRSLVMPENNQSNENIRPATDCGKIELTDNQPVLVWKASFVNGELAASIKPILGNNSVIYSNSYTLLNKDRLIAFDKHSGSLIWTWESPTVFNSNNSSGYVHQHSVSIGANGSFYNIQLESGQTNFAITLESKSDNEPTYGSGDLAYMLVEDLGGHSEKTYVTEIDLLAQTSRAVYSYPKNNEYRSLLKLGYPISQGNKDYVLIANNLVKGSSPAEFKYIVVFVDLETLEVVWETTVGGVGTIFNKPVRYKESVFVAHSSIHRLDLDDGSIIWEKEIEGGVGFAGMIMADGKLVIGTEGLKPMHHALNPETGDILWTTRTTGTASTMEYHNCVIYFTGGGDGKLHALNANTGEHLYILTSPDYAQNSNLYFGNSLAIDKATNRLYTHNWYNALCYQLPEY